MSSEPSENPPQPRLSSLRRLLMDGVGIRSLSLTVLMLLAGLYTLYFARAVIQPIVLALIVSFLLAPIVRFFRQKVGLPSAMGAALVMLALLSGLGVTARFVVQPGVAWVETVPARLPELKARLSPLLKPLEKVREASQNVGKLADITEDSPNRVVKIESSAMTDFFMANAPALVANFVVIFVLLYFMLASGDMFLRKLVRMIPTFQDKRRAVEIAREIQDRVSRYLGAVTLINLCLGFGVGVAAFFVGLENYLLWGLLACVLNYIPYFGAIVGTLSALLIGLLTFDSTAYAFVLPAIYIVLNSIEGNFVTPLIVGRLLTLNPVMVLIFLLFWGWIWGIIGALLAVPLLAVLKIVCDHFEPLKPISEFVGGENPDAQVA